MAFELQSIVPWGRSFEEYRAMFALSDADLTKQILGCADGPASFNAKLTQFGGRVVSIDPLYAFGRDEILSRINETFDLVLEQARKNQTEFVWEHISNIEELGRIRMDAMNDFLADYAAGRREQRYQPQSLPVLTFPDKFFDLCLCSHFLFLYSEHLSLDFHLEALKELCRVAREVRIFPLLQLGATPSPHLDPICEYFSASGYEILLETVPYEFQRGGNRMLRIHMNS
ncbi:MAG: hypothetical protein JXR23_10205 [Pontiellaceae bacterium]|nr:hypothetical protein [Pontiellaceae bacterium]